MTEHIDYGIDLGTTNSCITRLDGDEVTVIQNSDQMNVTPSVVRVLRSGSMMVGRRAYNAIIEDPDNVAAEFKRLMGQKYQKTFPAAGRSMSPEELSAQVLKSLLGDARRRSAAGEIRAAVITVPAAFTALQCEATARASRLAGLDEFPLLQEPIAAAIAYGAKPDARDQRWLVFDLGGGTLDIAVVSTRDGRLHVLEHRGDNHLGSKDIDRLLVQNIFLPFLAQQFALPDASLERQAHKRLFRKLTFIAEYAKIDLSTLPETIVSLIDLGDDTEGEPIEAELTLTRSQLEHEVQPLLERCLQLADDALKGARIEGSDLDRILLVGGPTQMPYIRATVSEHLSTKVDYSLDPMTVVARGAAIYASTIEQAHPKPAAGTAAAAAHGKLSVRLAFDPVSSSLQTPVAGKLMRGNAAATAHEVLIETDNNFWTSGWHQIKDEYFEMPVTLQEGRSNRFLLTVRDGAGRNLEVEPNEFIIRHGLVINAPPLPHTISVEVAQPDGTIELSPVFPRATLLPAEKTVSYRAARTLRPSDYNTSLTIKLWEGEALTDTQANTWVGNMHIHNDRIRRPIPEGALIQLHIKIDASRLITVEVFIPHLNEHFSDRIYIPQDEEPDYLELLKAVPLEMESYLERLNRLEESILASEVKSDQENEEFPEIIYEDGDLPLRAVEDARAHEPHPLAQVERLRREIEDLDLEISLQAGAGQTLDHDLAKGLVERARQIRVRLSKMEREATGEPKHTNIEETAKLSEQVERYVNNHGSSTQKERFAALQRELQRSSAREDNRGIQKAKRALIDLRTQILYAQDWFWRDWFEYFQRPGREFVNQTEAKRWLAQGEAAQQNQDQKKLEEAVRRLWDLEPYDEQTAGKERAVRPGLKL
jgi:molecular chaperone DnaK